MAARVPISDQQRSAIRLALMEDGVRDDVTALALVPREALGEAVIVAKEAGVHAGVEFAFHVFSELGSAGTFEPRVASGDRVVPGQEIARLTGRLRDLLA